MPDRNPFEETMRAGQMNVPQRTTRADTQQAGMDRWNANRRYEQAQMLMNEPGARAKEAEVARDFGGNIRSFTPHLQQGINTRTDPARATELGWAGNWPGTPLGYSMDPRWNYTTTPGDPFDYTQRSGPSYGGGDMDSGQYLASRFGGGLDDAAGMNDGARGMIEDAGFEVAGMGTDTRAERKLWGLAVNSFPVGTPEPEIQRKWEELKQDYYDRKYGGDVG